MPYDMSNSAPPKRPRPYLQLGNGHQKANRRRAQWFVRRNLPGIRVLDESTVGFGGYGVCHFAAYTEPKGAMISSTRKHDYDFGSMPWHRLDHIMMFRDMGDGRRVVVYVCEIPPLFGRRTVGNHGVSWNDIRKLALYRQIFLIS